MQVTKIKSRSLITWNIRIIFNLSSIIFQGVDPMLNIYSGQQNMTPVHELKKIMWR